MGERVAHAEDHIEGRGPIETIGQLIPADAQRAQPDTTTAFVVRNSAGLMGLVAIGTTLCGAQYAWTLPIAWVSFALYAPLPTGVPMQVAGWMLLPPGTATGTWTALVLAVVGTAAYAFAGPRR
ncbi:hypothetical protein P1P75_10845 [Streptomyces sp. ID05-39B]|uniref:hypothetical protein n=1 Tax=Streptomyces sp. ID05-39B TaxID=3028664 RepID=UPI0029A621DB|nr:hypothetical protein [Streptomyces sp. ID05-39B]MDX3526927.1 hypothetical protein [Streptomyces sp. ID05-39B]